MAEWPSPCNGQVTFLKLWPSDLPHAMVKWPSSCQVAFLMKRPSEFPWSMLSDFPSGMPSDSPSGIAETHIGTIFVEVEALNRALLWCQAVRFPLRSIVSDCLTLVRRLQKRSFDRLALSGFIAAIASSLFSFPGASISFIPRTENTIAHNLAREALGTDEEMIWNNLSSSL
ncbi:hypothetical protein F8388_019851 [Cannabis sativa]|uniref:RNase H type-1 domain-containing protein n=1 Tax=Cannabis sativa TaxID=3483 RepID=A0A7J6HMS6_CANSA|nr:hypothetical protein F8388_019851 [Cannabis sativa]